MTPTTEAGRRLLADLTMGYVPSEADVVMPAVADGMAADILRIEAEAVAAREAEIAAAVGRLPKALTVYPEADAVYRIAVLAIVTAASPEAEGLKGETK